MGPFEPYSCIVPTHVIQLCNGSTSVPWAVSAASMMTCRPRLHRGLQGRLSLLQLFGYLLSLLWCPLCTLPLLRMSSMVAPWNARATCLSQHSHVPNTRRRRLAPVVAPGGCASGDLPSSLPRSLPNSTSSPRYVGPYLGRYVCVGAHFTAPVEDGRSSRSLSE